MCKVQLHYHKARLRKGNRDNKLITGTFGILMVIKVNKSQLAATSFKYDVTFKKQFTKMYI